jgi:hypothetical protein
MNYKTIFLGAVIGASIPNAHGMYQQGYNQSQYPQQRSNVSNNNNANMPVAPNATNSNNPPPYAPSSAPLVENDSIARLAAAIEAMNKNFERMAIAQENSNKILDELVKAQNGTTQMIKCTYNASARFDRQVM